MEAEDRLDGVDIGGSGVGAPPAEERERGVSPRGRSPPRDRSRSRDRGGSPRGRSPRGAPNERERDRSERNRERISLLVRNVADSVDAPMLRERFAKYGTVKDVHLPLDFHTKRRRGFAFVEFTDMRDAEDAAQAMNRQMLDGR